MNSAFARCALTCLLFAAPAVTAEEPDAGVLPAPEPPASAASAAPDAGAPAAAPPPAAPAKHAVDVEAKWGEGVTLKAIDGDLSFNLRGRLQLRFTSLIPGEGSTARRYNEFLVRRARLTFKAKYREDIRFDLQLAFAPLDVEADAPSPLRDVYATWSTFKSLQVRLGQMKVPFDRQFLTSSASLEFADRTGVVSELNLERDVGLTLRSDDLFGLGLFGYSLGVFGGEGRNRLGLNPGLMFSGRLQVTPLGAFKDDLSEGDLTRHHSPKLALAVAAARNNNAGRDRSTHGTFFKLGTVSYTHFTADLLFKWQGLSLLGSFLWRRADASFLTAEDGSFETTRSGYGWFAQASYQATKHLAFGARFSDLYPMDEVATAVPRARELSGFVDWYHFGHDLKAQLDYTYASGSNFVIGAHQIRVQVDLQF